MTAGPAVGSSRDRTWPKAPRAPALLQPSQNIHGSISTPPGPLGSGQQLQPVQGWETPRRYPWNLTEGPRELRRSILWFAGHPGVEAIQILGGRRPELGITGRDKTGPGGVGQSGFMKDVTPKETSSALKRARGSGRHVPGCLHRNPCCCSHLCQDPKLPHREIPSGLWQAGRVPC